MKIIGKMFVVLVYLIFPASIRKSVMERFSQTKEAFTSNVELKVFWHVLFSPITILVSLIIAILKTIIIWILPSGLYGDLNYMIRTFTNDITNLHMPIKLAFKRMRLCLELFTKGREKRVSFGEKNPDITFFVIRPYYFLKSNEFIVSVANLLFHYYRSLQHLSHAVDNGWIPVIDWENYGSFPHEEEEPVNGTRNCWEYYWNQPSGYTLEEVYQSKNVILSSQNSHDYGLIPSVAFQPPFSDYVKKLVNFCPQYDQLISLNNVTAEYIQEWQDQLFPKDARILGVSIRGASYGSKKIAGHPVQPMINELVEATEEVLEEWKMDFVFFTCELAEVVDRMKEAFGDRLITVPRKRYEKLPTVEDDPLYVKGQRYQTNLDYLTEMVLLSRCDSLLAGLSGGVRMAIIWNAGNYRKVKIFDLDMWK